jgi:predicted lipid-binding transport protein (Tim44 family)
VDLPEPVFPESQFPEPQFPELEFPELKIPTLEFSTPPATADEPIDGGAFPSASGPPPARAGANQPLDGALATREWAVPDLNREDVESCARDAFAHLQAAISLSDPERCRAFVTEEVGQAVRSEVETLSAGGRRRVRGDLDILDATVIRVESPDRVGVRIEVVSSRCEMDDGNNVVEGSPDLVRWSQDLAMTLDAAGAADRRWLISALQPPAIGAAVTGPAGPPMDPAEERALDRRIEQLDRWSDEHEAGLTYVASSNLIHPGSV